MDKQPLKHILDNAVHRLQQGDVVVVPTETVYGLAASAVDSQAVAKIYTLKNRPPINPLIAHCLDVHMISRCAVVSPLAHKVLRHFSPGAITVVLPRIPTPTHTDYDIVDMGCAGLPTIAVRIPSHPIMHRIIKMLGCPIFAPSANVSGRLSPTTFKDARHALRGCGQDILVIDGGDCALGLESTIVQIMDDTIQILRHGAITRTDLQKLAIPVEHHALSHTENPIAPGQLTRHYAPNIPLYTDVITPSKNHAYLGFGDCGVCDINLSPSGDVTEAGRSLFASLHTLNDAAAYAAISVAPIPNIGVGIAINDKLRRAATKNKNTA